MGNNKGRSRACTTCLRRRVKCDQQRPACIRCARANIVCKGYREMLFIDAKAQVLRKLGHTSPSGLRDETSSPKEVKKCQSDSQVTKLLAGSRRVLCDSKAYPIWPAPSESAMRHDHFIAHLVTNLDGPIKIICHSQLLAISHHVDSLERVARNHSFQALATTFYGLAHAQLPLVLYGRRLYLQALSMVNTTISCCCDSTGFFSETLSSVVALSLHELLAMHGSLLNRSNPLAIALLEVTRPMMIVAALIARRPSLMAQPEWNTTTICLPNDHHLPSPRSALAYLLNAFAQLPALYCEYDTILSERSADPSIQTSSGTHKQIVSTSVQTLLSRAFSLRDDICFQSTCWTTSDPDFEFSSVSPTIVASTPPYPCTDIIHFSSPQAANVVTFYNAITILINELIVSSLSLLPSDDINVLTQAAASEQTSTAISHIIRSVDYSLPFAPPPESTIRPPEPRMASASGPHNFYLTIAIRVAHRVLSQSQAPQDIGKKLWLEGVLCTIQDRGGTWMSNDHIFRAGNS
ncbi:uncharacterized protein LY89DRAFT_705124 [Mollisia scopiformis]|uniref:Zn(2)-C6 fungal-type domain-containing protein n=1 Tax=Mollisia scopiformis TaxID=149040 RepID=A0A194XMH9_MOLSC|nr:uncharacterized protein LY89DRAFT_705124 [Mollisia scopiformis]KUJ21299.1 hypothetical protein LY89DRAFT_705124 [Mollisia scopiformis]